MSKNKIYIILLFSLIQGISYSQYFDGGAVAGLSASQVDGCFLIMLAGSSKSGIL